MMETSAVENFYHMHRDVIDRVRTRQITCYDDGIDEVDGEWGYLHVIGCDGCIDHYSQ